MLSSCPFLKSPSSRIKKAPDISSDDVIEKSASHTAEFAVVFACIDNHETSHASEDTRMTPERVTSSSWRPYFLSSGVKSI
jgi:hypothetical protein